MKTIFCPKCNRIHIRFNLFSSELLCATCFHTWKPDAETLKQIRETIKMKGF